MFEQQIVTMLFGAQVSIIINRTFTVSQNEDNADFVFRYDCITAIENILFLH